MRRGFSLLEVVVAMAILALSLMAIFSLNAGAIANHTYTKKLTVATLLARSKMIDLEQELFDQGLPADDDEESGDFAEEGWPSIKWRAKIIAPKTQGLSPEQMMGALFNLPLGTGDEEDPLGGLSALFGGGNTDPNLPKDQPGGLLGALGPMGALAQTQFTQMVQQITESVREVHLTVSWRDGKQVESIDLVTHIVSLGPGSDRNVWGGGSAPQAAIGGNTTPGWVRQTDGRPVANPVPGPNGAMVDPADNTPVIPLAQWMAMQAGSPNPGLNSPFGAPAKQLLQPGLGAIKGGAIRPPLGVPR